jgi:hypothetical protein
MWKKRQGQISTELHAKGLPFDSYFTFHLICSYVVNNCSPSLSLSLSIRVDMLALMQAANVSAEGRKQSQ